MNPSSSGGAALAVNATVKDDQWADTVQWFRKQQCRRSASLAAVGGSSAEEAPLGRKNTTQWTGVCKWTHFRNS